MKNLNRTFFRGITNSPIFCNLITAKRAICSAKDGHPTAQAFYRKALAARPGAPSHVGWGIYSCIWEGRRCFSIPHGNVPNGDNPWEF